MNTVVAFHGQQGSGKSTLSYFVRTSFADRGVYATQLNVKDTFSKYAIQIADDLGLDRAGRDLLAFKEIQKAISCSVEMHYKETAWSDIYAKQVSSCLGVVVTDDIRTPMNLAALLTIAESREVVVFRLLASESVRRARCPAFRENAGYTEELLKYPGSPSTNPAGFRWVDLDTERPMEETRARVLHTLGL